MQSPGKMLVSMSVCAFVLLGGCRLQQDICERQEPNQPSSNLLIKPDSLRITNTMIELRCEIRNNTSEDIWVYEAVPDVLDQSGMGLVNATVFVDKDDRTLIVNGRIGTGYGRKIWYDTRAFYTRLRVGQSLPEVLRTPLPIPDYAVEEAGFLRILRQGVDHLTRVEFQIGYFTEKDLASLKAEPDSIHRISPDESGNRIDVRDSSQGKLCGTERTARIILDGICLPYKEWLKAGAH
jgi:hypothetical protein